MIRFALHCSSDHRFEGWFRSGDVFAEQAEAGCIACPTCGDRAVRKAVMAPAIMRGGGRESVPPPAPSREPTPGEARAAAALAMLRQVREHVERNFEDVGDRFADEVRGMHLGEAERRDVFGKATPQQARDLLDEGISVRPLPELPKLDG